MKYFYKTSLTFPAFLVLKSCLVFLQCYTSSIVCILKLCWLKSIWFHLYMDLGITSHFCFVNTSSMLFQYMSPPDMNIQINTLNIECIHEGLHRIQSFVLHSCSSRLISAKGLKYARIFHSSVHMYYQKSCPIYQLRCVNFSSR